MKRRPNTRRDGKDFSKEEERAVWEKAQLTDDPNARLDICGREIHFDKYGDTGSDYGWEIDHIKPVSKGGRDEIDSPWQDGVLCLTCHIVLKQPKNWVFLQKSFLVLDLK